MDGYSRFVAWLKVLLPLAALGILSTLFLLSRTTDPVAAIPFADEDLLNRVKGEQISQPVFSGATRAGDRISLQADRMRTGFDTASEADNVTAQIDFVSGSQMTLRSDRGLVDGLEGQSELAGNVIITTSQGMRVTTDLLLANMNELWAESPGPVTATGPIGRLDAGRMRMETRETDNATHLVFTNGVKLIYQPQTLEE